MKNRLKNLIKLNLFTQNFRRSAWLLKFVLSFQMAFLPAFAANQSSFSSATLRTSSPDAFLKSILDGTAQVSTRDQEIAGTQLQIAQMVEQYWESVNHPVIQQMSRDSKDLQTVDLEIPADLVDQNPFKLRGQRWQQTPRDLKPSKSADSVADGQNQAVQSGRNGVLYQRNAVSTVLHFPEIGKSLTLNQSFQVHGISDDNIWLSLPSEPGLRGFWLLNLPDVLVHSEANAPVPLYFLPMPADLFPLAYLVEEPASDWTLAVPKDGDGALTIPDKAVDQAIEWQKLNLTIARSYCIADRACRQAEGPLSKDPVRAQQQILRVLPPAGSVALNGFVLMPEKSVRSISTNENSFTEKLHSIFDSNLQLSSHLNDASNRRQNLGSLLSVIWEIFVPTANALPLPDLLSQDWTPMINHTLEYTQHAASVAWTKFKEARQPKILGVTMVIALIFQFTILKERLSRLAAIRSIEGEEKAALTRISEIESLLARTHSGSERTKLEAELKNQREKYVVFSGLQHRWKAVNDTAPTDPKRVELLHEIMNDFEKIRVEKFGETPQHLMTFWQKRKVDWLNTWDTYAHAVVSIFQFGAVTFSNTLEYTSDKLLFNVASAQNSPVRRFMVKYIHFSRSALKNANTSGKMFALGGVVKGVIDSTAVALQYVYVAPPVAAWMAEGMSQEFQAKVSAAFDLNNPDVVGLISADTMRNLIAILTRGAIQYSSDSRSFALNQARETAEKNLRTRGLDPFSPNDHDALEAEIETIIEQMLLNLGVPSNNRRLFDYNTVLEKGAKYSGYGLVDRQDERASPITSRKGLAYAAAKRALALAMKSPRTQENLETRRTLKRLIEEFDALSNVGNMKKLGISGVFARMQKVRASLVILAVNPDLSYKEGAQYFQRLFSAYPDLWQGISPEAAYQANFLFRYALTSYTEGDGELELTDANTVRKSEERLTKERLAAEKNRRVDFWGRRTLGKAHETGVRAMMSAFLNSQELRRQFPEIAQMYEEQVRTQTLTRTDGRFLVTQGEAADRALRSISPSILARAEKEVLLKLGLQVLQALSTDATTDIQQVSQLRRNREFLIKAYYAGFTQQVSKTQGLTYTEGPHVDFALANADAAVESAIRSGELTPPSSQANQDPESWFGYYQELGRIHSTIFLTNYIRATIDMRKVNPLHEDQPGMLQFVRKWSLFKKSVPLTMVVRILESSTQTEEMANLGFKSFLFRRIPFVGDLHAGFTNESKRFLSTITATAAMQKFFWGLTIPYPNFVGNVLTGNPLISGPTMWLNRFFTHIGYQPVNTMSSTINYVILFSTVTFFGLIPCLLFASDFAHYVPMLYKPVLYSLGGILSYLFAKHLYIELRGKQKSLKIHKAEPDDAVVFRKSKPIKIVPRCFDLAG